MKIAMSFTIEYALCELLKVEENASALVDRLLRQHFSKTNDDFEEKMAEYKQKIKEIKQKRGIFRKNQRERYKKLLSESKRRNTKLTFEAKNELAELHKKYGGDNVRKE